MASHPSIPPAEPLRIGDLISSTPQGISSRLLAKTSGGSVTLFSFDAGQELSEHTTPFDALVLVLDGALKLKIGGKLVSAASGELVRMPGHVPHAVEAAEPTRMLLIMLRESP